MDCRDCVVSGVENFGDVRHDLKPKRGPHLESDHPQVEQQNCRLAGAVSSATLLFCQDDALD